MNRLPAWLRQEIPDVASLKERTLFFKDLGLNTVCQGAHCPNMGTCFSNNHVTFMILGSKCSRNCQFCAVEKVKPEPVNNLEPQNIAKAVDALGLDYVVITSVTRDDLSDGGARQFAKTIKTIRAKRQNIKIEVLIPDFRVTTGKEYLNADTRRLHTNGRRFTNFNLRESVLKTSLINLNSLKIVLDAKPDVIGHNIETVPRLYPKLRPQADYERSIALLKNIKDTSQVQGKDIITKSALMLGLGEDFSEVLECLKDLKDVGCDILCLGQYLSPSKEHFPVQRFLRPDEFEELKNIALSFGFKQVISGPLVRSSYKAREIYEEVRRCTM